MRRSLCQQSVRNPDSFEGLGLRTGYFSGKPHMFTAKVSEHPKSSSTYTVEGQWNGPSKVSSSSGNLDAFKSGSAFLDAGKEKYPEIKTRDIGEQDELESRKVWKDVADGIRKGDFDRHVYLHAAQRPRVPRGLMPGVLDRAVRARPRSRSKTTSARGGNKRSRTRNRGRCATLPT